MKHLVSALALCAALPVCAQATYDLVVNAPAIKDTLEDKQELSISPVVTVEGGMTVLLDAKMTFTRPTEELDAPSAEDKISIAVTPEGMIVVSDGTTWEDSGVTVADNESKHVKIATVQGGDSLSFDVTIDGMAEPLRVAATDTGTSFGTLAFEGDGSVTGLAVAAVPTAILPAPEGGAQDPEVVAKYTTWLNDADKGGAMPEGSSETELSDAFAMNVGGTPSLAITAITPPADGQAGSITVAGSYVPVSADGTAVQAEATSAPLNAINGTLYITYASELGGEAKTQAVEISAEDGETKTVTLPVGAIFVKARVALTKPTDTTL